LGMPRARVLRSWSTKLDPRLGGRPRAELCQAGGNKAGGRDNTCRQDRGGASSA
jgi:hypothetical protein